MIALNTKFDAFVSTIDGLVGLECNNIGMEINVVLSVLNNVWTLYFVRERFFFPC